MVISLKLKKKISVNRKLFEINSFLLIDFLFILTIFVHRFDDFLIHRGLGKQGYQCQGMDYLLLFFVSKVQKIVMFGNWVQFSYNFIPQLIISVLILAHSLSVFSFFLLFKWHDFLLLVFLFLLLCISCD